LTYQRFNVLVLLLLFLSAAALGSFNYVIDPYNKNSAFDFALPKSEVSKRMHYPLYKVHEFQNSPKTTILLGDSRTGALDVEFFEQLGEDNVINMAYGGGTIYEVFDTFWFVVESQSLKRAFIGLPFSVYSEANKTNRFVEAKTMIDGPFAYYFSPFVAKTGFYNVASKLKGSALKSERPDMNKEQFWNSQLGGYTTAAYGSWRTSAELQDSLQAIVDYCDENSIELTFFIPPTHTDLQNKVGEFNLTREYNEYLSTLTGMAKVIDFDFANDLTRNPNNFKDPYHFTSSVSPFIARVLLDKPLSLDEQSRVRFLERTR